MDTQDEYALGRVGQVVGGRWTLERLLGTGGMAAVYAARDETGQSAAVKLLHPEMSVASEARERFLREGKAANAIEHPGVVRVLEDGTSGDWAYLVMELLEGETLDARLERHGTVPPDELLGYLDQVLDVLAKAHERGIVHRDLKPDNLFVTTDGRVKVLDYGIARVVESMAGDFKTRTGMALGTLPYMAPEQALGRRGEIDGRTDLFALGATAFRILAGRKVHEADTEAELLMAMASKPAPPLRSVAPGVPEGVAAIVDLALAFAREARYPDARTMQADVRAVRGGASPPHATGRRNTREDATRAEGSAASRAAAPAAVAAAAGTMTQLSQMAIAATTPGIPVSTARSAPVTVPTALGSGGLDTTLQTQLSRSEPWRPALVPVLAIAAATLLLLLLVAVGAIAMSLGRSGSSAEALPEVDATTGKDGSSRLRFFGLDETSGAGGASAEASPPEKGKPGGTDQRAAEPKRDTDQRVDELQPEADKREADKREADKREADKREADKRAAELKREGKEEEKKQEKEEKEETPKKGKKAKKAKKAKDKKQ